MPLRHDGHQFPMAAEGLDRDIHDPVLPARSPKWQRHCLPAQVSPAGSVRCPDAAGFRLAVADLRRHPGYRGPEYVGLGAEIAVDGHLDPAIIGAAARTGRYDAQALKRVWHYVARFGSPAGPPPGPPAGRPGGGR